MKGSSTIACETPLWWDDAPLSGGDGTLPARADVLVVGAGYAGLHCALELVRGGAEVVVIDAGRPGFGGSSRNGGQVTGGWNMIDLAAADRGAMRERVASGLASLRHFEATLAAHGLCDCYQPVGKFVAAFALRHLSGLAAKAEWAAHEGVLDARVVDPTEQESELGSAYYHGGVAFEPAGLVQPARYLAGLLAAATREGAAIVAATRLIDLERVGGGWRARTSGGALDVQRVVIATNGYTDAATPDLRRGVVPVASYIIATEPLPDGLPQRLIPKARGVSDTARVLSYFRLSPDGRRMVFGGRVSFSNVAARQAAKGLTTMMLRRFPELAGVRVTNAWSGNVAFARDRLPHMGEADGVSYALACNGSGVAMMGYLGERTARRILDRPNAPLCAFDAGEIPKIPLYVGKPWFVPLIGAAYHINDRLDRLTTG